MILFVNSPALLTFLDVKEGGNVFLAEEYRDSQPASL